MSHTIPAASGGFVYRAERSSPSRTQTATQPAVGPGTYEVTRTIDPNPAPVPFHTSSERVLAANPTTSAITPGPGAYGEPSLTPAVPTGSLGGPASPFVSGVPRLPLDAQGRAWREVPGPGTYDSGNQWVRGSSHYRPHTRASAAGAAAAAADGGFGAVGTAVSRRSSHAAERVMALLPRRRPTAPSVPGRGESYGYEEEADGSLVLQAPPEKSHTGVGIDTVGPGKYELGGGGPFVRPTGTAWATSRSNRGLKAGSCTPGVGTYNLADSGPRRHGAGLLVTIGGVEVVFGGSSGTSSFVSKALRPLQKLPAPAPGPGDYNNLAHPTAAAAYPGGLAAALRTSSAGFGSTAVRGSWEVDPTAARAAPTYWRNPGPGAYEDPRARVGSKTAGGAAGAGGLSISGGGGPTEDGGGGGSSSGGWGAPSVSAVAPFSASSPRFHSADNAVPGPGEYHPDAVTSLEFDTFKRTSASRPAGAFGGSSGRFHYHRGASSPQRPGVPGVLAVGGGEGGEGAPGPAHYEPRLGGAGRTVGRAGTSNFASRTGRFRPVTAPPAVPDLSDYDGTNPLRGDPSRLGPGSYSPERPTGRPRYNQAPIKIAPFGTDSNRARVELPSSATPGPGRYPPPDPAAHKPTTQPPPKAGFTSQADRFAASATFTPGPGAYVPTPAGAPIVRKSYNVTYNGGRAVCA